MDVSLPPGSRLMRRPLLLLQETLCLALSPLLFLLGLFVLVALRTLRPVLSDLRLNALPVPPLLFLLLSPLAHHLLALPVLPRLLSQLHLPGHPPPLHLTVTHRLQGKTLHRGEENWQSLR